MPYEISVFRYLLQGDLSPRYFPVEPDQASHWYEQYLSTAPTFATKQVHAQFEGIENQILRVNSRRVHLLDQHPEPIFVAEDHTVYPEEAVEGEALLSSVFLSLSLAREAVLEWYHWQDERGQLHLELFAQYPLDALSPEEQRYYFYQCLLDEQLATIQDHMVQYVHETPSAKKARTYVRDHRQDLLIYASEVLQYLGKHPPVYTRPDGYSLPDVYHLIFLSLKELIDFLEQQFGQYRDADAPLPYHHQVVYATRLSQPLTALRASLLDSAIDRKLITIK